MVENSAGITRQNEASDMSRIMEIGAEHGIAFLRC